MYSLQLILLQEDFDRLSMNANMQRCKSFLEMKSELKVIESQK